MYLDLFLFLLEDVFVWKERWGAEPVKKEGEVKSLNAKIEPGLKSLTSFRVKKRSSIVEINKSLKKIFLSFVECKILSENKRYFMIRSDESSVVVDAPGEEGCWNLFVGSRICFNSNNTFFAAGFQDSAQQFLSGIVFRAQLNSQFTVWNLQVFTQVSAVTHQN